MLCKVTHCTGRVSTNTRPHQLRYACSCVVRVLCLANLIPRLLDSMYKKLERSPGTSVVYVWVYFCVDLFLCGSISVWVYFCVGLFLCNCLYISGESNTPLPLASYCSPSQTPHSLHHSAHQGSAANDPPWMTGKQYMWQSRVEIEHYSVAYFDRIIANNVRFLPGTATHV